MRSRDPHSVRVGRVALDLERLVYATIVVMAVLAAYDGWAELSLPAATVVVVAPVLAVCVAHAFSEALHEYAARQHPLTGAEWAGIVRRQLPILLVAVPRW